MRSFQGVSGAARKCRLPKLRMQSDQEIKETDTTVAESPPYEVTYESSKGFRQHGRLLTVVEGLLKSNGSFYRSSLVASDLGLHSMMAAAVLQQLESSSLESLRLIVYLPL